jgi:acetyltransferase-like isoleucine patch superfamily enzyme
VLIRVRAIASGLRVLWRGVWFRVRFAGRRIRIHPTSMVSRRSVLRTNGGGCITIGAHCEIHDFAMILTYGGNITMGDHCSLNPFSIVYGQGGTQIGSGVRIAAHTVIIPANHLPCDDAVPLYLKGFSSHGIRIEDGVWIASGCTILDAVTIGRHAVIGAGSVVTRSIEANVTAMGVPARVLTERRTGNGQSSNS